MRSRQEIESARNALESKRPANARSGTTPFPNRLLDEIMPVLGDTEWRLVCVIARQTLGWRAGPENAGSALPGGRKQADWLTHSQLKARTGRAGAAVSGALDALVRRGLVQVRDGQGRLLRTPWERRGAYTRLYFSLAPEWVAPGHISLGVKPKKQQSPDVLPESENQKAKTTKANGTKLKIALESIETGNGGRARIVNSKRTIESITLPPPASGLVGLEDVGGVEAFLATFQQLYRQYFPNFEGAVVTEAELRLLHVRLGQIGHEELARRLEQFFACDFGYVKRRHYSLGSFLDTALLVQFAARHPSRDTVHTGRGDEKRLAV